MSTVNKYKLYLEELGTLLKEQAQNAKVQLEHESEKEKGFDQGVLFAYYRIISIMQQQTKAFDISLKDINLSDIDPDKQLT